MTYIMIIAHTGPAIIIHAPISYQHRGSYELYEGPGCGLEGRI